jgi:oxygen-independent coproporphyrinogen-3 oxidase
VIDECQCSLTRPLSQESMLSERSLLLAERSVPRYTSYPTAPHFTDAIGPDAMRTWLDSLDPTASLSLYLHVPYCRSICHYCGCNTKAARKDKPLDEYAGLLKREIEMLARATRARQVKHIHWGGGTPSQLGAGRLREVAEALASSFNLSQVAEHAIELDPRYVDEDLAQTLVAMGVNRVSFGVQDINPRVQQAIGRVQSVERVEHSVSLVRAAGIEAINIDLMYGLPHQTEAEVRRTAQWAAGLKPKRLAIFGYAHVPWMKKHQNLIDTASLPGAGERLAQAAAARDELERAGYVAIGLDHFADPQDPLAVAARDGTLRRNFQGYTTDCADALLPLGVSSIGYLPQGYVQNAPDMGGWKRAVEAGEFSTVRGLALSPGDRARASVIERLMCDFAVDFGDIAREALGSHDALDDAIAPLDALANDGVVEREGRMVRVVPAAQPFVRLAAACFDSYLQSERARHSVAV